MNKEFLKGSIWALAGRVVSAISMLAVTAIVTRLLSVEEVGAYFLILSLVSFFSLIGTLGLNQYIIRLVAEPLAKNEFSLLKSNIRSSFILVFITTILLDILVISGAGSALLSLVLTIEITFVLVLSVAAWILTITLLKMTSETFRGFNDIKNASVFGNMLSPFLLVAFLFILLIASKKTGLIDVILLSVFTLLVSIFIGGLILREKTKKFNCRKNSEIKKIIYETWPLLIINAMSFAISQLDIWILGAYRSEQDVAVYGAVVRLVGAVVLPLSIINSVIPPKISKFIALNDVVQLERIMRAPTTLISILAAFIFALLYFGNANILAYIFGESYKQGADILSILALGQFINVVTGSCGVYLNLAGMQKLVMFTVLVIGVVSGIFAILVVETYGAIGVAWVTTAGLSMQNIILVLIAKNRTGVRTYFSFGILSQYVSKLVKM